MATDRLDVVALGNAIVDVLAHEDDSFLEAHGLVKGSMQLVDEAQAGAIYGAMGPAVEISGGSAANTTVGVASLGGAAAFGVPYVLARALGLPAASWLALAAGLALYVVAVTRLPAEREIVVRLAGALPGRRLAPR